MMKYLKGEIKDRRVAGKIETSLFQYLMRMCSRSTPFGLMAGYSTGIFGEATNIVIDEERSVRRHVRFDMESICKIVNDILADPSIRSRLVYYPNTSLYRVGNAYRYIEQNFLPGRREHRLEQVEYNKALQVIFKRCAGGAFYGELIAGLTADGYSVEEATGFMDSLILSQLLVSELDANVTGRDYTARVLDICRERGIENEQVHTLSCNYTKLAAIDKMAVATPAYMEISEDMCRHFPGLDATKLFQLDMSRDTKACEVDSRLKEELIEAVGVLKLLNNYKIEDTTLEIFKRAFVEKYEYATVKLTEALDTETGLEFGKAFSLKDHYKNRATAVYDKIMRYKLWKYHECIHKGLSRVEIREDELKDIQDNGLPLMDSFSVMVSVFNEDGEDKAYIKSAGGASAINMLSRFSHIGEHGYLERVMRAEELLHEEKIVAEIVHLPHSRVGNIATRRRMRDHEIPYLAYSEATGNQRISINDLYLKVTDNRFVLFSKKLQKEVIPKLTIAHNFTYNSLPLYRFLSELQFQGVQGDLLWDWGAIGDEDYLPRVVYKKITLSQACWKPNRKNMDDILSIKDAAAAEAAFRVRKEVRRLPKYVYLVESDNELMLNLDDGICIRYLLRLLEKKGTAWLKEVVWTGNNGVANRGDRSYASEIIIPYTKIKGKAEKTPNQPDIRIITNTDIKRRFPMGSEWIYFKIYISPESMDKLLSEDIGPFCGKLVKKGLISQWFFVRYADPRPHIRLRLQLKDREDIGKLIVRLHDKLSGSIRTGSIAEVSTATYYREMERYGKDTMEASEQIFYNSSELVCRMLSLLRHGEMENDRILVGIRVIDGLLVAVGWPMERRMIFSKRIYEGYAEEFNVAADKRIREFLSVSYRENTGNIKDVLETQGRLPSAAAEALLKAINQFCTAICGPVAELAAGLSIDPGLDDVLVSHIHMIFNRLFVKDARMEELRAYCYLHRYYSSVMARRAQDGAAISQSA